MTNVAIPVVSPVVPVVSAPATEELISKERAKNNFPSQSPYAVKSSQKVAEYKETPVVSAKVESQYPKVAHVPSNAPVVM